MKRPAALSPDNSSHDVPAPGKAPGKGNTVARTYAGVTAGDKPPVTAPSRPSGDSLHDSWIGAALGTSLTPPKDSTSSIASGGVGGVPVPMPHESAIQESFGHHGLSGVSAFVGGPAAAACNALGATGYATGNSVAFRETPDLHTAAHEAAHVVQQRAGVHLKKDGGSNDALERHADQVADLVVGGQSAQSVLDQVAGPHSKGASTHPNGTTVQLKRSGGSAATVGGRQSRAIPLSKGDGSGTMLEPGDANYSDRMLGDMPEMTDKISILGKGMLDKFRVRNVVPDMTALDGAIKESSDEVGRLKRFVGIMHVPSSRATRQQQIKEAQARVNRYTNDKAKTQAKFTMFNSWVPRANGVVSQYVRIQAAKAYLGIRDDKEMVSKLSQGLQDARTVGRRSKDRYTSNHSNVAIPVPPSDRTAQTAGAKTTIAFNELEANYLKFQHGLLKEAAGTIHAEGAKDRHRLSEIDKVKAFLRQAGGTIDATMGHLKSAPAMVQNASMSMSRVRAGYNAYRNKKSIMNGKRPGHNPTYVTVDRTGQLVVRNVQSHIDTVASTGEKSHSPGSSGIGLPSMGKLMSSLGDFIYAAEIRNIMQRLDAIQARVSATNVAAKFALTRARILGFQTALKKYALAANTLQQHMAQRRTDYLNFGIALDKFAQGDSKMRDEGLAPSQHGSRYAMIMTLTAEIRLFMSLHASAASAFDSPAAFKNWSHQILGRRWAGRNVGRTLRGAKKTEERKRHEQVFQALHRWSGVTGAQAALLQPVEDNALVLMKSMGSKNGTM